ncbi:IS3 family transposase [Anaerotruncus colihominis]|uniref:IS3 family transposase n=1 Tax=Anaerotruncus colihominis TaxID=169435 RepID=UPI001897EE3C|nr:IS3 family transposase [Anaerotruncus colihominis]MBS4860694.1 IS3 family transposase [Eubacterium limosum]
MKFTKEEKMVFVKRYQDGETVLSICSENQIPRSTFYRWIQDYQQTVTDTGTVATPQEFLYLKRRISKLEDMIQVLKTVSCTVSSPLQEKLKAMEPLYGQFSVHALCDALEVSRGTFYNHIFRNKKDNTLAAKRREMLKMQIQSIYDDSEQIYGAGKITAILQKQGVKTSQKYASQLMKELGISSVTTTAKKEYKRWEKGQNRNFLLQQFQTERPNQVWGSDITVFKFRDKYYYLCVIIDLFSRKVISYRISHKSSTQLLTKTFKQAYADRRQPKAELVFHSDRGTQYMSHAFVHLLDDFGVEQSFSRTACPHDNAVSEAFFSIFKKEELYRRHYTSEVDLMRGIAHFIAFYNTERPHSTLQYKTPEQAEQDYWIKEKESSRK